MEDHVDPAAEHLCDDGDEWRVSVDPIGPRSELVVDSVFVGLIQNRMELLDSEVWTKTDQVAGQLVLVQPVREYFQHDRISLHHDYLIR